MACDGNRYNTGNPICSNDLRDLNDDTIIIDGYVNSEEDTVKDRFGTPRLTISGIENKVNDRADDAIGRFEGEIDAIIKDAGGVEISNAWGNSEQKGMSQKFMTMNSSRIPNSVGSRDLSDLQSSSKGVAVVNGETVEDRDLSNIYINGTLKHDGYDFVPMLSENMLSNQSRANYYGGQLSNLKEGLANPLAQKLIIKFIGDSNTWGSGTDQNATTEPRGHKMSDARDHFASNSFVNLFKRYIGRRYFNDAQPILSNHPESPSGQSIASYSKYILVFPYPEQGFTFNKGGHSSSPIIELRNGTISDYRVSIWYFSHYDEQQSIEFKFTGDALDIYYTKSSNSQDLKVEVGGQVFYIDGYQSSGVSLQNKQTLKFNFVKDAMVRISGADLSGSRNSTTFYLEGIGVNKTVEIHNNGIIGQSSASYFSTLVDKALSLDDSYCFVQFGGNDRTTGSNRGAKSISTLSHYLGEICKYANDRNIKPILITTSDGEPRVNEIFSRQDAANATVDIGFRYGVDVVDNYSVLLGTSYNVYTNDKTHLNIYGTGVIARNLINALESSERK